MSKAAGGFDFAVADKIIAREEEGITFEVTGPDRKPVTPYKGKPVTITVCGSYSPTYQQLDDAFNRDWLAGEIEGVPESEREAAIDAAWKRRVQAHDLAVRAPCIRSWYGMLDGGKEIEVTPETAARAVLVPWLIPQIREHQGKHEGFSDAASED